MKFKTRLVVAFFTIILIPLVLSSALVCMVGKYQLSSIEKNYGIKNTTVESLASSVTVLTRLTEQPYRELEALIRENPEEMDIRGRDLVSGLPKNITINSNQVCEALNEPVTNILDAVRNTLERTPPELAADIMDRGVVMTGGSSLLRNLDRIMSRDTGMPVYVSDDALSCVALGTGLAVENVDVYKKGFMASNSTN